jgi:ADP-ribosyl-[dinitrogen reductase] hydrolase
MIGAIAGDICGSTFEKGSCPREKFQFFCAGSKFTDDTVCSIAVAESLLTPVSFADALRTWVRRYPNRCYGGMFVKWAAGSSGPYNSFGNGGAMRVAPVGLLATSLEEAELLAEQSASATHNHPEGIKGAQAIAAAIWWARQGLAAPEMRGMLSERYGYDLSKSVAELGSTPASTRFSALAHDTVPQALICALEAESWEDAVLNSVEIGGDSDTLAAMSGAIAEARFGISQSVAEKAFDALPGEMRAVLIQLYDRAGRPAPWTRPKQA